MNRRKKISEKTQKTWMMSFSKEKKHGFSLIEAMVVLFIFSMMTVGFYAVASFGMKYVQEAKLRLVATSLAREKMEMIHALQYPAIGTISGVPAGDILATETTTKNGKNFYIQTEIVYADDPYDGTEAGSPTDTSPEDYKKVKITIAWEDVPETQRRTVLMADFYPQ